MATCESKDWPTMTLIVDGTRDEIELEFKKVAIRFGLITGEVLYHQQKVSDLAGTCIPLGPYESQMSFRFTLGAVEIVLVGIAFKNDNDKIVFKGVFRAFKSAIEPSAIGVDLALPDEGDTGTGAGMQAT
jgi:hypothetical protein